MTTNDHIEQDELLAPAFPVHPGLVLKLEVLPARKVKGARLARAIGATEPAVSNILNGKSPVTPAMALRIERAIGYSADRLVKMQAMVDLAKARIESAAVLEAIVPIAA